MAADRDSAKAELPLNSWMEVNSDDSDEFFMPTDLVPMASDPARDVDIDSTARASDPASNADLDSTARAPVRVLVTAATGTIAYALVLLIVRGVMLGAGQPIILHLLDDPDAEDSLMNFKLHLMEASFPLLKGVLATTDVIVGCREVDVAIILDRKITDFYKSQAFALGEHAANNCKILILNNNELIFKESSSIKARNITWLSRLEQNIAVSILSVRLGIDASRIKNVFARGFQINLRPDITMATVKTAQGDKLVSELVVDDLIRKMENFDEAVHDRGVVVRIDSETNIYSALLLATAACDHIHDWILGTPEGIYVSMCICSDGSNDVPLGHFCSFPVTCHDGEWTIYTSPLEKDINDSEPYQIKRRSSPRRRGLDREKANTGGITTYSNVSKTVRRSGTCKICNQRVAVWFAVLCEECETIYNDSDSPWMKCVECRVYTQTAKRDCPMCHGRLDEPENGPEEHMDEADYNPGESYPIEYKITCYNCEWTYQFFTNQTRKCFECDSELPKDESDSEGSDEGDTSQGSDEGNKSQDSMPSLASYEQSSDDDDDDEIEYEDV